MKCKVFTGKNGVFTVQSTPDYRCRDLRLYYVCRVLPNHTYRIDNVPLSDRATANKYAQLAANKELSNA